MYRVNLSALATAEMSMPSLFTLAEAANSLGVSSSTLKHQAQKGVLHATLLGKTYIVTADEIARYRREHLGKPRRPKTGV